MCLLVGVDDALEVDSPTVYLLFEHRKHSLELQVSMFV